MDAALIEAEVKVRVDQERTTGEGAGTTERVPDTAVKDAEVVEVALASEDVEVTKVVLGDKAN